MAQLIVRNLEDPVRDELRRRAAENGHSMEEEVRDILRAAALRAKAATRPSRLGSKLIARFKRHGLDRPIAELRGEQPRPARFGR